MAFPVPARLTALYRPRAVSRQLTVSMSLTNKGLLNPAGENNCFLNSTVQVSERTFHSLLFPSLFSIPFLFSFPSLLTLTLSSFPLPPPQFFLLPLLVFLLCFLLSPSLSMSSFLLPFPSFSPLISPSSLPLFFLLFFFCSSLSSPSTSFFPFPSVSSLSPPSPLPLTSVSSLSPPSPSHLCFLPLSSLSLSPLFPPSPLPLPSLCFLPLFPPSPLPPSFYFSFSTVCSKVLNNT